MNNELLKGSFMEERLKKYFRYMERVYGEDVALTTALTDSTIRASIAKFSDDFYDYKDFDIDVEMLKTCILTDKPEDTALRYANQLIANERIPQLLMDIQSNQIIKIAIVENYIRNMYRTSEELYNMAQKNHQYRIIDRDLENLENYKKSQEKAFEQTVSETKGKTLVKSYQEAKERQEEKVQTPVLVGKRKRRRLG